MPFPLEPSTPRGWKYLSSTDKDLLVAKRHADYARETDNIPVLIEYLLVIGEWAEAKKLGSEEASELIKAEARSDKTRCACPMPDLGKKFSRARSHVWVKKRDGVRPVNKCYFCGFLQIVDGEMDVRNAIINEIRASGQQLNDEQIMKRVRDAESSN